MTATTPVRIAAALTIGLLVLVGCSSSNDTTSSGSTTVDLADTTTTAAAAATTTAPTTTAAPATSAAPTTTTREPLADQTPPAALNGLEVVGEAIWVASIGANQVIEVDRTTGAILTRVDTAAAGPDDVTAGPDGAIYWTGFVDGSIGRIEGGESETINSLEPGANPLGFTDDGELIVGLAVSADGLYQVPLDGSEPQEIATDIGDLNAFAIVGRQVVGPTGGVSGPGSVTTVDIDSGAVTTVADGLVSVTASTLGPDEGVLYLLSGATGQVLTVNLETGETTDLHQLPEGFYDNLSFGPDGTLYVSHFAEPAITAVSADGTITRIDVGS